MNSDVLLFIIGLIVLVGGGELLVRSASRLAVAAGLSSLVIGLTIVAVGTSAPELAVGAAGAYVGKVDAGFGNVIGSNIFNILCVLGLVALFSSPAVEKRSLRFDIPFMIAASVATWIFVSDYRISHFEAALLFAAAVAFLIVNFLLVRREAATNRTNRRRSESSHKERSAKYITVEVALLLAGVIALGLGAHWVVKGATGLARAFGMSELLIGLTLIAGGTSLPELVTSLVAVRRGEKDIAVGNIFGSCIFNVLVVLPVMAALTTGDMEFSSGAALFDVPVMVAAAVACIPLAISGRRVSKAEGAGLLVFYIGYIAVIFAKYNIPDSALSSG
ncbi:MAG: calcium/sodium antiporter [Candidatus Zixiibacteriota bacterium]